MFVAFLLRLPLYFEYYIFVYFSVYILNNDLVSEECVEFHFSITANLSGLEILIVSILRGNANIAFSSSRRVFRPNESFIHIDEILRCNLEHIECRHAV